MPVVLVTPPELPPPAHKPRRGPGLVLTLLLLALLGYGGWWYYLRPPPPAEQVLTKPAARTVAAQPVTTNTSLIASLLPSRSNILSHVRATLEAATQTPERRELILGETNPPPSTVTAVTTNKPAPLLEKTNPPPQTASAPAKIIFATNDHATNFNAPPPSAPAPKALPVHVNWPKLNVTGIMGRAGGGAIVFINGQILKIGDTIAGARILAIQENGAQLVLEGETNFFRVGKGAE